MAAEKNSVIVPSKTVTFTVTKRPQRLQDRKTIQRLMRMQPHIQSGLRKLSRRRRQIDNRPTRRAGLIWIDRARTTKLTFVNPGEEFTLRITPQIMPDIASVSKFLDAKPAT